MTYTLAVAEEKRCTRCKETKPASEFYGLSWQCQPCARAYMRDYGEREPEKRKEASRNWVEAHPEAYLAQKRRWAKGWRARNPEENRVRAARWYGRKKDAFVEHVDALIVLERCDGVCGICGHDVDPTSFEIDHIIALSRGGLHNYENSQIAHPVCNRRKSFLDEPRRPAYPAIVAWES